MIGHSPGPRMRDICSPRSRHGAKDHLARLYRWVIPHRATLNMKDDQRALSALATSVQDSISIIETGIKEYVFQRHDPAYRQVATELRKLLMDRSAAASYAKSITRARKAKSIFELHHGNGKNILLNSFRPSTSSSPEEFVNATPNIYKFRGDILHAATHDVKLVPLRT